MQAALDETGAALEHGDFASFKTWFTYPYRVDTFDGMQVAHDASELQKLFERALHFYARHGIQRILRTPISTTQRADGTLLCTYETLLIPRDGAPDRAPYVTITELRWDKGRWLVFRGSYAIADSSEHNAVLLGAAPGKAALPQP